MLLVMYLFFLIIQLALFNLVILGILFVFIKRFWVFLEAIRWKIQFNYRTKLFVKFIQSQMIPCMTSSRPQSKLNTKEKDHG